MTEQRFALIIATSRYDDPKLKPLPGAAQDCVALSAVLGDMNVGHFSVQGISDRPSHEIALATEDFVNDRTLDDLVLIYITGHGLKDKDGKLYFAASNTLTDRLISTAISSTVMNDLLVGCRSRRKVLILDCCFGGAFLKALMPRSESDRRVGLADHFPEGRGLVVITASDALQFAFEGDTINGHVSTSVFTGLFVQGLKTGQADRDGDGLIGITELFHYVSDGIRGTKCPQRPEINNFRLQGEIFIAKSNNVAVQLPLTWEDAQTGGRHLIDIKGRTEEIVVPEKAIDGQQLRFEEKGLGGTEESGVRGDLIVSLRIAPPPLSVVQARHRRVLTAIVAAMSTVFLIVAGMLTFRHTWVPTEVGNHWPSGSRGSVSYRDTKDGTEVFGGLFGGKPYARLWDARTAKQLFSVEGDDFRLGPHGHFLLVGNNATRKLLAVDMHTYNRLETPFPFNGALNDLQFGPSGTVLMSIDEKEVKPSSLDELASVRVWSLNEKKDVGAVTDVPIGGSIRSYELNQAADLLIALCRRDDHLVPAVWDLKIGRLIGFLATTDSDDPEIAVDSERNRCCTLEERQGNQRLVTQWDLRAAKPIRKRLLSGEHPDHRHKNSTFARGGLRFSHDGSLLFIGGARTEPDALLVLRTADFQPDPRFAADGWWIRGEHSDILLSTAPATRAMGSTDGAFWSDGRQIILKDLSLQTIVTVVISRDESQAVLVRDDGRAELWNVNDGKKRQEMPVSKVKFAASLVGREQFYLLDNDGMIRVFDFANGKQLASLPAGIIGDAIVLSYDPDCQKVNAFAQDGRVLRFAEQFQAFGRTWWLRSSCQE